ncbi:hypothetical protein FHS95_002169 [Sphingomonas naasensis]|uniref:Uncharacterized protein n=1 Tax=Sphingomonas naasensis TaxID=1344951 RepID=A0A4S1WPU4_9SPHN|nr:hypothetical protein [Sphingomonas naasensis]NIJ20477.1 hypothetical protein [Sphingomonas naasensis]TGX44575.1 hypothetical protein E5A74_07310 [Sphingomonas naasensis]
MDSHHFAAIALFASTLVYGQTAPPAAGDKPAGQEASEGSVTVTGKKDPKKKLVCQTAVSTGSVIPKRTCNTVAELEERAKRDRATLERLKEDQNRRQATQTMVCLETGRC